MKKITNGKYIVAVSGGVDSMVLLDRLHKSKDLDIIVAHFNHGIRDDSYEDEKLVSTIAKKLNLDIEIGHGNLGAKASEELARRARYKFLKQVRQKQSAKAIVTAHHQDDLIETAFINILRGTGYRGLTAMITNPHILRPMLDEPKKKIISYAKRHGLKWREDSSNSNSKYLRNYIRQAVMVNLSDKDRRNILDNINNVISIEPYIRELTAKLSQNIVSGNTINRREFTLLPALVSRELLAEELHKYKIRDYDKKTIERLELAIKTGVTGKKYNIQSDVWLEVKTDTANFTTFA